MLHYITSRMCVRVVGFYLGNNARHDGNLPLLSCQELDTKIDTTRCLSESGVENGETANLALFNIIVAA